MDNIDVKDNCLIIKYSDFEIMFIKDFDTKMYNLIYQKGNSLYLKKPTDDNKYCVNFANNLYNMLKTDPQFPHISNDTFKNKVKFLEFAKN